MSPRKLGATDLKLLEALQQDARASNRFLAKRVNLSDSACLSRLRTLEGGAAWGVAASLIETRKLNKVEPFAYLGDALSKIAECWPRSRLDDLLPWNYQATQ